MEDFIFGTLSTDELKVIFHRAYSSGIRHANQTVPQDPIPGQPVTIVVETGPNVLIDEVACYFSTNGEDPEGCRGRSETSEVVFLKKVNTQWDTLKWAVGRCLTRTTFWYPSSLQDQWVEEQFQRDIC